MLRAIAPVIAFAALLTVVACGGRDPVANGAENTAGLPAINDAVPDATGSPPEKAEPTIEPPRPAATIPVALQGRWGLTPLDCTSTRGDAKGLLVVRPGELRFYESRAVPAGNAQTSEDSISGDFHFTGEGQTWTRFESLTLDGDKLVRTESNPMASFTYARCK
ncbi:MAG TPA: hypothetical protein VJM15_01815 [Sphingomicrobium sp.]|nr:hypothetical protein [Sphingomicrobium sp.]